MDMAGRFDLDLGRVDCAGSGVDPCCQLLIGWSGGLRCITFRVANAIRIGNGALWQAIANGEYDKEEFEVTATTALVRTRYYRALCTPAASRCWSSRPT